MKKKKEILHFISENKKIYFDFLMKLNGFPYICDYSSEILVAYLNSKFNLDLYICSGNFDFNEDLCHNWIQIDDTIIDFTLIQFMLPTMEMDEFKKIDLTYKEMPSPIINKNNDLYYKYEYLEEYSIENTLINVANKSNSFEKYLLNVKNAIHIQ